MMQRVHLLFAPEPSPKRRPKSFHTIHARLRNEIEEQKTSLELVTRRNAHIRASQHFKQTAELTQ